MEALITLEKSKVKLRFLVLSVFLFWGVLSAFVWYYITSVSRAPTPSLSSYPLAERINSLTLKTTEERTSSSAERNRDALEAYRTWEASFYQSQRSRGSKASQPSSPSSSPLLPFLPPVILGYTLRLLPLCSQASPLATLVFSKLSRKANHLRVSGLSFLPSRPKLYGSIFSQGREPKQGGADHQGEERPQQETVKKAGEKEEEEKEFVSDLRLLFSSSTSPSVADSTPHISLSLLRVVLLPPPSSSRLLSSSSCPPPPPPPAGAPPSSLYGQDEENDGELTYRIFFSSSSDTPATPPGASREDSRSTPERKEDEEADHDDGRVLSSSSSKSLFTSPGQAALSPRIILHADSSITVLTSASSPSSSSSVLDATTQALLQLLRDTFFRAIPLQTSSFLPFSSQYDLTFWLAGDASPSVFLQQKQTSQQRDFSSDQDVSTTPTGDPGRSAPQNEGKNTEEAKEEGLGRLTWKFDQDVYHPFLQPFFSRISLLYDFPQIQSQVIPLSGINSLLKPPSKGRFSSRRHGSSSSSSSASPPWVLDLASQHKLHAVASTWEPEQILTELTNAPSPEINFAIYRSPVPIVLRGGEGGKAEEEEVFDVFRGQDNWHSDKDAARKRKGEGGGEDQLRGESKSRSGEGDVSRVQERSRKQASVTGIAISGWGSLIVLPPPSSSSSSSSLVKVPPGEMRDVCGVLIAQMRSFFSLPSTLADYFEHLTRRTKDSLEEEEEDVVLSDSEDHDTVEQFSSAIVRDQTLRKALLSSSFYVDGKKEKKQRGGRRRTSSSDGVEDDVVMIWRTKGKKKIYPAETEENTAVIVVAQHSPAGVGLWELWRLALPVYVHLVQRAVTNIRSLQRILENQTELAVPPHVGEALERALTFIDCSVEALQRRLCSRMPQGVVASVRLAGAGLSRVSGDARDGAGTRGAEKKAAGGVVETGQTEAAENHPGQATLSSSLSSTQYLALSLSLARAAYRDSLEALHDESVTGQAHFKFEFKVAIYLPVVVPFLLPVLIGFLKVHKMNQVLKRAAAALHHARTPGSLLT